MEIEQVQPRQIRLTSRGGARILVRGRGVGFLRCQGQTRFVYGSFCESFAVHAHPKGVVIYALGLTGFERLHVPFRAAVDVHLPRLSPVQAPRRRPRRLLSTAPRVPRVAGLSPEQIDALAGQCGGAESPQMAPAGSDSAEGSRP